MTLHSRTAAELATLLERAETTSVEIVEALFARADDVDHGIQGWTRQLRKSALAQATECDRRRREGMPRRSPIDGLPVTVKENIEVAGTDATAGLRARAGRRSSTDAVTVRLLRDAGAIVLGKSNVPQTLIAAETVNFLYGRTSNPWNLERTPGGSSGGESALIASGQSLFGVGTDIGGSIRIPAHFTGICGLKPTMHRWSNFGSTGAIPGQEFVRSQIGPLARTSEDLARLFWSIPSKRHAKYDPEVSPARLREIERVDLSKLRVGYYDHDGFLKPSAAIARAVRQSVDALRAAGAEVVPVDAFPGADGYFAYVAGMSADGLRTLERELGGEPLIKPLAALEKLAKLPPLARKAAARGLAFAGEARLARLAENLGEKDVYDLFELNVQRLSWSRAELTRWNSLGLHALICPPYATPAPQHDATGDFSAGAYYAFRYNLLNLPAGVVPVTRVRSDETRRSDPGDRIDARAAKIDEGSEGLPVGVQIVGRPFREDVILALMIAVEKHARLEPDFPVTPIAPSSQTKSR